LKGRTPVAGHKLTSAFKVWKFDRGNVWVWTASSWLELSLRFAASHLTAVHVAAGRNDVRLAELKTLKLIQWDGCISSVQLAAILIS